MISMKKNAKIPLKNIQCDFHGKWVLNVPFFVFSIKHAIKDLPLSMLLKIHLVRGVEKWNDRKCWEDERVEGQKKFYFLSYLFG